MKDKPVPKEVVVFRKLIHSISNLEDVERLLMLNKNRMIKVLDLLTAEFDNLRAQTEKFKKYVTLCIEK